MIEPCPHQQMRDHVEKPQKPQSAAELDEVEPRDPQQRRYHQRGNQKAQRPDARLMLQCCHRISAERIGEHPIYHQPQRDKSDQIDHPNRDFTQRGIQGAQHRVSSSL